MIPFSMLSQRHIKELLISHLIHEAKMKTSFRIEESMGVNRLS
jgi:hypothetical protein